MENNLPTEEQPIKSTRAHRIYRPSKVPIAQKDLSKQKYLTVQETTVLYPFGRTKIYKLIKQRTLSPYKTGKEIFLLHDEIKKYIEKSKVTSPESLVA